jgi:CRP/FNR family cyclic AMP-dependent transcriptional regulator
MKKDDAKQYEEDARELRKYSTFDNFSDDELERLARTAHRASTSAPSPLIHEQTPSDSCYILLSGEAGVYIGRDRVALLGPGEVIGEAALQRGKLRSATVTTTGPAQLLRLERDDLAKLLDEIPALRKIIDESVARHVPVDPPEKPKPVRTKLSASVPTAIEDALTQWAERNSKA